MDRFDGFEVHPVLALDQFGYTIGPEAFKRVAAVELEQCDEDDPDIYCWSVYGHLPELWSEPDETGRHLIQAGIECLADCPTKEIAEYIRASLEEVLFQERRIDAAR